MRNNIKEWNTLLHLNLGAYLFCMQKGKKEDLDNLEYMLTYYNNCDIKNEYKEFFKDTKDRSHADFYNYIIKFYIVK